MAERGRICLHAPYLYPLFVDGEIPFAGGAETQQAAIARELRARDFDVSVVACDYGQPQEVVLEGIRFIRSYDPERGVPGIRFVHPRLTKTVAALQSARADVYYARGAGLIPGLTYDVARRMRSGFVLACAHDLDTEPDLPRLPNPRDRWWHRRAVRHADRLLAQSRTQQLCFREHFGRKADVVPNLVYPSDPGPPAEEREEVVWLSTYKESKRPDWFVSLARRLPARPFVMRGVMPPPPSSNAAWDVARTSARELPNLTVDGYLSRSELPTFLSSAALFVHTSPAEGFPNTLLEAWAHGVPSIVCNDPDGVVRREGLGEAVSDREELATTVEAWMNDPERRSEAARRARRYVADCHGPEVVMEALAGVFDAVIRRRP